MSEQSVPERWPSRVAILGVGLLGGSVARAIRCARPQVQVVGWSRRESTSSEALQLGVIDEIASTAEAACEAGDVIVVAAPVDRIAELSRVALDAGPESCLVTDVGSTKAGIVQSLRSHRRAAANFVAAHPIAGREKAGVSYSVASLFDGKWVVLTPDTLTMPTAIERATSFWKLTGANVISMDAEAHDATLAATSHVPHLVSAAVAKLLPLGANRIVGSGWMDTTRVAAGDPEMWAAICRENPAAIQSELRRLIQSLQTLDTMLSVGDDSELRRWLAEAKTIRDQIQ